MQCHVRLYPSISDHIKANCTTHCPSDALDSLEEMDELARASLITTHRNITPRIQALSRRMWTQHNTTPHGLTSYPIKFCHTAAPDIRSMLSISHNGVTDLRMWPLARTYHKISPETAWAQVSMVLRVISYGIKSNLRKYDVVHRIGRVAGGIR